MDEAVRTIFELDSYGWLQLAVCWLFSPRPARGCSRWNEPTEAVKGTTPISKVECVLCSPVWLFRMFGWI
jgi:hypothetical protein